MKRIAFVFLILTSLAIGLANCAKNRSNTGGLSPKSGKDDASKTKGSTTVTTDVLNIEPEKIGNLDKWVPANGKILLKDLEAVVFDFPSGSTGLSFPSNKVGGSKIKFSEGEIFTQDETKINPFKQSVCTIHFSNSDISVVKPETNLDNVTTQDPNYPLNYKGMKLVATTKIKTKDRILFRTTKLGETTAFSARITSTVEDFTVGCFKGKVRILVPPGSKQAGDTQTSKPEKKS